MNALLRLYYAKSSGNLRRDGTRTNTGVGAAKAQRRSYVSAATDFSEYGRLQDFIAFAKTGAKIKASAAPTRQLVTNKVHPGSHEEMKSEVDMFLYTTVFTFHIADEDRKVAKVYMVSSTEENADQIRIDTNIANQRLKLDYERLKAVGIEIKEQLF